MKQPMTSGTADYIEPRTWCARCGTYGVDGSTSTICPVCTDDAKRTSDMAKLASLCRG